MPNPWVGGFWVTLHMAYGNPFYLDEDGEKGEEEENEADNWENKQKHAKLYFSLI